MAADRTPVDIARNAADEVALFIEPQALTGEVRLSGVPDGFILRDEAGREVSLDVPDEWMEVLPHEAEVLLFEFDTGADRLVSERRVSVEVASATFRKS